MVSIDHVPHKAATTKTPQSARRRRLPNPAEQARRAAWGRQWGGMIGAYWRNQRAKGA